MKNIKSIFSLLLVLLCLGQQHVYAQLTTVGTDFYVGFMENNRTANRSDKAVVIITANEDLTGFIRTPVRTIDFELQSGEQFVQEFSSDSEDIIHRNSGEIEFKSLYISTTGNVSVHAFNERARSADGTVVLPLTALGKEYYVMAHHDVFGPDQEPGSNTNFESTLLVVATEDDTDIEIITTANTVNTIPAGAPINITLQAGETYQLKAIGDLTGSSVRVLNGEDGDCKNVAVFGGNKMTSAGDCGTTGDHLFQQAYPTFAWGKSFVHISLAGRTSGEIVKVLASKDNTEVRINGQLQGTIDAGEFLRAEFDKDEVAIIETSNSASVASIAKSQACNESFGPLSGFGDPSLITYSPNNQRIEDIIFSSVKVEGIVIHYANVLVPAGSANQTRLNGQNVGDQFQQVPGNPDFEFARLVVREGANSLSNPEGFIGYAYGSGFIESYGYAIGASLERIQFETETDYGFEIEGDKVACFGKEGLWTILPENEKYIDFTWDFGDGSSLIEGQEVAHTFESEGTFEVKVLASTGEDRCDSQEEFKFEVEVVEVLASLEGPLSICPDVGEVQYFLENTKNLGGVDWEIIGGDILVETDSTVTVIWNNEDEIHELQAIPLTEEGCQGELLILEIDVSDSLTPELPEGPSGICGEFSGSVLYTVPFPSDDYNYSWTVIGGFIVSGQDSEQIEVDWDINAAQKSIFYQLSSTLDASCSGSSETLEIGIYPAFNLSSQVDLPSCLGTSDGVISIVPTGGSGSYIYKWSHDSGITSASASGLSPGNYIIEVSDATNCAIEILEFELTDPESIEILEEPIIIPTKCAAGNDGEILIKLKGGTGQLQVFDFQSVWDGETLVVSGIPEGSFSLFIQDESGCGLAYDGEMTGPEPLQINFIQGSPSCPGGNDGELTAEVLGGVGPFIYLWEDGSTSQTVTGLSSGDFEITITDANGCTLSAVGIVDNAVPQVRMPTGFNPQEGLYLPIFNCPISYEMIIWDRWGQLVYTGSEGWNGEMSGTESLSGVYSYLLQYTYEQNSIVEADEIRGSFTLIR